MREPDLPRPVGLYPPQWRSAPVRQRESGGRQSRLIRHAPGPPLIPGDWIYALLRRGELTSE